MIGGRDNHAIVALGGGTGLSTLLAGLKHHTTDLTAIVTMADDGGSSGRLRREIGILPPGDVRNCLVALADDDSLLTQLFRYRFGEGELAGHSFGNLFLAALAKVTGDFETAVHFSSQILGIRGTVLPASLSMVSLQAEMADGCQLAGQSSIANSMQACRRVWLDPADIEPPPAVLEAIARAELIIIGPGSLFTSVIPNLLIPRISEAVTAASCPKLFVCNVMTKPSETLHFTASRHLASLIEHAGEGVVDTILVNTTEPPRAIVEAYGDEGAAPVTADEAKLSSLGVQVLSADMGFATGDYYRHDSVRLGAAVMSLLGAHQPG